MRCVEIYLSHYDKYVRKIYVQNNIKDIVGKRLAQLPAHNTYT